MNITIKKSPFLKKPTVKVWDPLVRLFHWSLVISVFAAYLSGEENERWHELFGYAVIALISVRFIWGWIGSYHARFVNFVASPGATFAYLRDLILMREKSYLGHNPAGAMMILALLLFLACTTGTGWLMISGSYADKELLEEVHEFCANTTMALVALHVAGVIWASLRHKENLIKSMLTGKKRAEY
ncbi:cytochrome b/b6 domain-containing protein [Undibacterium sp. SXout7W]|uniref:cytochrome b/b6 domain-containing protein n=1 Tax=Undibacterium sp. SXout7W TaxID=3413049 RepID=UPI003BF3E4B0